MTAAHYKGGHHPGNDLGLHYTALPPIVASCPYSDQLLVTRKFWSPGANRPSQASPTSADSVLHRVSVFPVDPIHRMALEVAADGGVNGRKEGTFAKLGEKPEALELVFYRVFKFGKTQLDPGLVQSLVQFGE